MIIPRAASWTTNLLCACWALTGHVSAQNWGKIVTVPYHYVSYRLIIWRSLFGFYSHCKLLFAVINEICILFQVKDDNSSSTVLHCAHRAQTSTNLDESRHSKCGISRRSNVHLVAPSNANACIEMDLCKLMTTHANHIHPEFRSSYNIHWFLRYHKIESYS